MADDLPDAGLERSSVPMLVHGCAFVMCVPDAAGFEITEVFVCDVPAVPGVF